MNQRIARIKSNRFDMAVMLTKNREEHEMTGREHFLGFRLVPNVSGERDPAEEQYWGAILPLRVARKHPELLGLLTVHYQTVYSEERLPDETRFIVRPGKCRIQSRRLNWRVGLAAGCALAIATYLGVAFSQKLWPF